MTKGSTTETVDGMSLRKINAIIEALRYERYQWTPVRRVYIEKKNSTKKRPLGMPTWSDKLLQEVIRLILEAYYEPQFSECSHGFRPNRGCHTALREIDRNWLGTVWFIEGDIKACFDSLDHEILLSTLAEKIQDGRFIRLIRKLLQAGYLEDWKYNQTLSGTPQGGIISPILSNIYLDKLDKYVEKTLVPDYTKGDRRKPNLPYQALITKVWRLRKEGKTKEAMAVRAQAQHMSSVDPTDANFRRLKYVRYADDWLIGYVGTKEEAEEIKYHMKAYLQKELKLKLSEEKTLITHAKTAHARFLGYHISVWKEDAYHSKGPIGARKRRSINGQIVLGIPADVLEKKSQRYLQSGKPVHRAELLEETVFSIIATYQAEYRGLVQYYQLASNIRWFGRLKWTMEQSLTKALASKLKISVLQVYGKFQTTFEVEGRPYKGLQTLIPREGKKPLVAKWGGIPLRRKPNAILNDQPTIIWKGRSELEKRLLADTCELCGSQEQITVHHIRALKDLTPKGRREKPPWMILMAARKRKTLVVCWSCHMDIHYPMRKARNKK